MRKKEFLGELLLLLTAVVWGLGFVAQSLGMDYIGEFTLIGTRNFLAVLALEPIILLNDKKRGTPIGKEEKSKLLKGGLLIGVILFFACAAQQFAISFKDAAGNPQPVGKVSFLTSMYMVLVPAFGVMFFKRKSGIRTWISVAIGLAGMYLLCGLTSGGFTLNGGDIYAIACSVLYAFQIIFIDKYAPDVDCVRLSQYEFAVCGVLSMICAFIFEDVTWSSIWAGKWAILYLGLFSSGVGYTLQTVGQKFTRPSVSTLLMSLESVFGALFGFILLGEHLSGIELIGCALMFCAVIFSQLDIIGSEK